LLSALHEASLELLAVWKSDLLSPDLPAEARDVDIRFECGDATVADWSDGDVVFANSTCFDEWLMAKLATTADRMAVGSFFVTFTKRLPSAKWEVLEAVMEQMSWGGATVFIHKKVAA